MPLNPVAATLEFDHIGLIVADLAAGRAFLEAALGLTCWTQPIDDPGLRVSVQFGSAQFGSSQFGSAQSGSAQLGPEQLCSVPGSTVVYELVAPLAPCDDAATAASPIAGFLRQNKGILNHMAYRTPNLAASAAHLRELGCFPAGQPQPAVAYSGCLIQFWVSPLRFLIELIEKPGHSHPFIEASDAGGAKSAGDTSGGEGS